MPGTSPLLSGLNSWTGCMTSIPFASRRRHRHRVGKSLPGRHSRPADAGRECRHLPTRPAGRHFRRHGPARKCRTRARRVTAGSVTMAVACMILSSTWAGARPAAFLSFFRHARTCSTAVRFRWGGPGAMRWDRPVSGRSAGSGHGSRPARTRRPFSPAVTPDLIRGPGPQAPPSPGFPGPRIKSGVTAGGRRRSLSWARRLARNLNRTAMEQVRA